MIAANAPVMAGSSLLEGRLRNLVTFAGGLVAGTALSRVRARLAPGAPDAGPVPRSARQRRLGAALAVVLAGAAGTGLTAAALAVLTTAGQPRPTTLVGLHVGCAAALAVGLAVKLALLGRHALRVRARRTWPSFAALLANAVGGHAHLTGGLVLWAPAWA